MELRNVENLVLKGKKKSCTDTSSNVGKHLLEWDLV